MTWLTAEFAERELIPERWEVQRVLGWCMEKLERPAQEQKSLARDTDALLERLADSLSGDDRDVYMLNKWTDEKKALVRRSDDLEALERRRVHGFWPLRWGWRFQELRRLDELLVHLDGHRHRWPALLRRLLSQPRDLATLVFLVLPDRVLIVRAGYRQIDFSVSRITHVRVNELVTGWHELMRATAGSRDLTLIGAPPPATPNAPARSRRSSRRN